MQDIDIEGEKETHQMYVQTKVSYWPDGIHYKWPNGDVGHETAIHNVYMNPVATCIMYYFNLEKTIQTFPGKNPQSAYKRNDTSMRIS